MPALPGCVAAADTREKTEELIREAIVYHLAVLRESGDPVPDPDLYLEPTGETCVMSGGVFGCVTEDMFVCYTHRVSAVEAVI